MTVGFGCTDRLAWALFMPDRDAVTVTDWIELKPVSGSVRGTETEELPCGTVICADTSTKAGSLLTRSMIVPPSGAAPGIETVKAARIALGKRKDVDASLVVDAIVMATAALMDAIVVTGDPDDFELLATHFAGVSVLSV